MNFLKMIILVNKLYIPARFNARFKNVSVVKMLHRFRAQINAQMFQLRRFGVFKTKHIQNTNKPIGGRVPNCIIQSYHGFISS